MNKDDRPYHSSLPDDPRYENFYDTCRLPSAFELKLLGKYPMPGPIVIPPIVIPPPADPEAEKRRYQKFMDDYKASVRRRCPHLADKEEWQ